MEDRMTLSFNIQGEFITKLAREWLFYEGKGYEKVMDLLLSCMDGTDMGSEKLKRYAEDVLLGRAKFSGSTADGSFHMTVYEPEEQPEIPEQFDIFKRFSSEIRRRKEAERERDKYREWYSVAMEYVPEYAKNQVLEETGQPIKSSYGNDMLSSFIERMMDEEEHSTGDYGWLEPDGTFHEVAWGNHQEWANDYLDAHLSEEEQDAAMIEINLSGLRSGAGLIGAADYLVRRGWVLLHNPSQGVAIPTRDETKRYTRKQQDFLYDYYMERGKEKEANAVYEE